MKPSTKEFIVSALFMIGTVFAALVLGILVGLGIFKVYESFRPSEAAQEEETTVEVYKSVREKIAVYGSLEEYTEGEGEPPVWWNPDEPMAVEWEDPNTRQSDSNTIQRTDIGCPDWNYDSTLWGWDGHHMEVWEMNLFSRIFYLEFWQPNLTLCEAGCDAMLGLWELNGGTMFETLSHVNENGSYSYSTYPGVWDEDYDPEGLEWCREFCEERFYDGPVWPAQYFRKWQYHDWDEWSQIPAYEIDGIYFSIAK